MRLNFPLWMNTAHIEGHDLQLDFPHQVGFLKCIETYREQDDLVLVRLVLQTSSSLSFLVPIKTRVSVNEVDQ